MRSYYFDFGSDRTILLTGQIHGNEPISKLVLMGFAQGLIEGSTFETNNNHIYQYNFFLYLQILTHVVQGLHNSYHHLTLTEYIENKLVSRI